ncbi:hypothetical protein [Oceanivirga salmonicida]|uniref:hypothetical protein n=1 Tax=Oceanivirga salmonicida TaxID=1769291 RepID=UPI000833BBEE|nr:hypothetical protein [Oceanivirga salmonicida]
MNKKFKYIIKILGLLILVFVLLNIFFGETDSQTLSREMEEEYNIILPIKEFEFRDKFVSLLTTYQDFKFKNIKYKTKYKDISESYITSYNGNVDDDILSRLLNLYVINDYIRDKSMGNNYEETEKIIDKMVLEIPKKVGIDLKNKIRIDVFYDKIYRDKNIIGDYLTCYKILDNSLKELEEDCSFLNQPLVVRGYLRKQTLKYTPQKTRYDELNFKDFLYDNNIYPSLYIFIDLEKENKEKTNEVIEILKKNKYLEEIRKNYNNKTMATFIWINYVDENGENKDYILH